MSHVLPLSVARHNALCVQLLVPDPIAHTINDTGSPNNIYVGLTHGL